MLLRMTKPVATALALTLGLSLAACSSPSENRSLDSIRQPVVERSNYMLDLYASSGGGLAISEQRRLDAWFEAMGARYGDRISVDDPLTNPSTKEDVAEIAARYGLLISDGAPATQGLIDPGKVRIVITRSRASVPGCTNWEGRSSTNFNNATHDGFGCAVNGNLAAMVADPEHLVQGATSTGETLMMTSTKAIETYRGKAPTGTRDLSSTSSASGVGGQ